MGSSRNLICSLLLGTPNKIHSNIGHSSCSDCSISLSGIPSFTFQLLFQSQILLSLSHKTDFCLSSESPLPHGPSSTLGKSLVKIPPVQFPSFKDHFPYSSCLLLITFFCLNFLHCFCFNIFTLFLPKMYNC
jgi:hypothetical protein